MDKTQGEGTPWRKKFRSLSKEQQEKIRQKQKTAPNNKIVKKGQDRDKQIAEIWHLIAHEQKLQQEIKKEVLVLKQKIAEQEKMETSQHADKSVMWQINSLMSFNTENCQETVKPTAPA